MTWKEYYRSFHRWDEETRFSNISALTEFGSSKEVCEIAQCFDSHNVATLFIRRALRFDVKFTSAEITELVHVVYDDIHPELLASNKNPYTVEQIDDMKFCVDDDLREELYIGARKIKATKENIVNAWENAFDVFTLPAVFGNIEQPESKHCSGNCSNCPPHYGYRYGRWYYGHGHSEGCQFGGNKCDGGCD